MFRRIFINMETKKCSKCKENLSLDNFYKDKKSKDGKQSVCKNCKKKLINEYYKHNPHKRSKISKESNLKKYYKNKVSMNFSRRMRKSLNGLKDGMSWTKLVDYDLIDLKNHLEKQFTEGMSWDNYGEWHIDHKIPISKFNITSVEDDDFKKCWALDNLQPLWGLDNIKKSDKLIN